MERRVRMTASQFARLHDVNKRTLHYYDQIGLFSPGEKGENRYRYYDSAQGLTFEYIRMLKELNMSIEEIREYLHSPNTDDFIRLADEKTEEIDRQIEKLKRTRLLLAEKKKQAELCRSWPEGEIRLIRCGRKRLLTEPYPADDGDFPAIASEMKAAWGAEQFCVGIGSYIAADRALRGDLDRYDGLFTPVLWRGAKGRTVVRSEGNYLCVHVKGSWDGLLEAYLRLASFAERSRLTPTGFAYEWGMNDLVIAEEAEYVTRIAVRVE